MDRRDERRVHNARATPFFRVCICSVAVEQRPISILDENDRIDAGVRFSLIPSTARVNEL